MKQILLALALALSLPGLAADHYVDNAASGANDGTSWANAWQSFAAISWVSVNAGDTVYISGGTTSKTYAGALDVQASGTSGNPVTITCGQSDPHDGQVILDDANATANTGLEISNENYVVVSGQLGAGETPNIIIRNHQEREVTLDTITGVEIEYLEVGPHTWSTGAANDDAIHASSLWGGAGGNRISYCKIHDFYAYGILINRPDDDHTTFNAIDNDDFLRIDHNEMYNAGEDIIHSGAYTGGYTIDHNHLHTQVDGANYSSGYIDGMQLRGLRHVTVSHNEIHDLWTADGVNGYIYLECDSVHTGTINLTDVYVFNNVIWDTDGNTTNPGENSRGIQWKPFLATSITNLEISNNTIVDTRFTGIMTEWYDIASANLTNIKITNNLIYNNDRRESTAGQVRNFTMTLLAGDVTTGSVGDAVDIIWDHNLSDGNARASYCRHGAGAGTIKSHAQFKTDSGCGDNDRVDLDPSFAGWSEDAVTAASQLALASGDTAAKDAGTTSSVFSDDFAGRSRPYGAAWDIGAYEFANATATATSATAGSLTVD